MAGYSILVNHSTANWRPVALGYRPIPHWADASFRSQEFPPSRKMDDIPYCNMAASGSIHQFKNLMEHTWRGSARLLPGVLGYPVEKLQICPKIRDFRNRMPGENPECFEEDSAGSGRRNPSASLGMSRIESWMSEAMSKCAPVSQDNKADEGFPVMTNLSRIVARRLSCEILPRNETLASFRLPLSLRKLFPPFVFLKHVSVIGA
ncbi:hypothetical protein KM043_018250 [Ampulex compressa]|nr:hypothetical protein KM043_018250 [Ampulex compressa]